MLKSASSMDDQTRREGDWKSNRKGTSDGLSLPCQNDDRTKRPLSPLGERWSGGNMTPRLASLEIGFFYQPEGR